MPSLMSHNLTSPPCVLATEWLLCRRHCTCDTAVIENSDATGLPSADRVSHTLTNPSADPEANRFVLSPSHQLASTKDLNEAGNTYEVHRVSVIWSSDIWSFWLYFGYMVNGRSDFGTKFFGHMVILAIWSTLSGQNRGPYIRNQVYLKR